MPAQNPTGTPNTNKPTAQPTFLSSAAAAPAAGATTGGKTLLGRYIKHDLAGMKRIVTRWS